MADEVVTVAIQTGENTAAIEAVKEEQTETAAAVENIEKRIRWNDESLDYMRTNLYELEKRVAALETAEANEELNEPGIHDAATEPVAEQIEETVLAPVEAVKPKKEKKHSWGLF